jgi:hypothetical protein
MGDAGSDAAHDAASDTGTPVDTCSATDLSLWRNFQISGQLMPTIAICFARNPQCSVGACDLNVCLRDAVGVAHCETCIAEETRCAVNACAAECSASNSSDACRACACRENCIGTEPSCGGMGTEDVCADCDDYTCQNMSALPLDPALIMVVIDTAM